MEARMFSQQLLISTLSLWLTGVYSLIAQAEQDFLPRAQLRAPYSTDIAVIDRHNTSNSQYQIQTSNGRVLGDIGSSASSFQDRAGKALYQTMKMSEKKRQERLTGSALMYGIEYFGYSAPVKSGLNYIKQKTRFKFGDCTQVRFSTKRLKARSCITDQTKIELKSSYKLNSFTLDFQWAL